MNKIKIFLILILLASSNINYAQDETVYKELDNISKTMFQYIIDKDFDQLLDLTYPKIYDLIPRDMMLIAIKSIFEGDDDISIDVLNEIPNYTFSKLYETEEKTLAYAFLHYDLNMTMTFKNSDYKDEDTKKMMINIMKAQGIEAKFITDNQLNCIAKNNVIIFIKDSITENT